MHLGVFLGSRSLNLGACRIIWRLRSCQIPRDQQVCYPQPPEVTSTPAPSPRDQNTHAPVAPLGAGHPRWGPGVGWRDAGGLRQHPPWVPALFAQLPLPRRGTQTPGCVVRQWLCLLAAPPARLSVSLGLVRQSLAPCSPPHGGWDTQSVPGHCPGDGAALEPQKYPVSSSQGLQPSAESPPRRSASLSRAPL